MRTPVADVGIAYEVEGKGRPVVLIHGLGSTMNTWEGVTESLSSAYQVIRMDLRGSGRSDVPPGPYSIDELTRDVLGVLDAVNVDAAHFVGHSLGSIIAMNIAMEFPERVRTLSLAAAGPGVPDHRKERMESVISAIETEGMSAHVDEEVEQSLSTHTEATRPELVGLYREMIQGNDPEGYAALMRALLEADLRGGLETIQVPTLLIAAADDQVTPPVASLLIADEIPDSEVTVLQEAGHMAHLESPDEVARAIHEFLANV